MKSRVRNEAGKYFRSLALQSARYVLVAAVLTAPLWLGFHSRTASADGPITLIHIFCVPELGYLSFRSLSVRGVSAYAALAMAEDELAAKYGLYKLQGYLDVEIDPRGRPHIVGTREEQAVCDLDGTRVEITFRPVALYRDLTTRVTLRIGETRVIDSLPFADASHGSDRINGFVYQAGESFLLIDGSDGPDSRPFFPIRTVSAIYDFGSGTPPLADFRTVFNKMIERAQEFER